MNKIKNFFKKIKEKIKKSRLFKLSLISLLFIPLCSFTTPQEKNSVNLTYSFKDTTIINEQIYNSELGPTLFENFNTSFTINGSAINFNIVSFYTEKNRENSYFDIVIAFANTQYIFGYKFVALTNGSYPYSFIGYKLNSVFQNTDETQQYELYNSSFTDNFGATTDNLEFNNIYNSLKPLMYQVVNNSCSPDKLKEEFDKGYNQGLATGQQFVRNSYTSYVEYENIAIPYFYSYDIVITPTDTFFNGFFSYNHKNILDTFSVKTPKYIVNNDNKLLIHKGDRILFFIDKNILRVQVVNNSNEYVCDLFTFNLPFEDTTSPFTTQDLIPTFYGKEEIDKAYNDGYYVGKNDGFNQGYNQGLNDSGSYSVFSIFTKLGDFANSILSINLAPGLTIGSIVLMPLIFGIFLFVIKLVKK